MGMNYYLRRRDNETFKVIDDTFGYQISKLCHEHLKEQYYGDITLNLCSTFSEEIGLHIGKSSMGWHFSLCIYPHMDILSLDDWKKLFNDPEYFIVDEEDREVSAEDIINIITNRSSDYSRSFEELHILASENHGEVGYNGLIAHKSSIIDLAKEKGWIGFSPLICIHFRTDGTYDLTPNWRFS